MTQMVTPPSEVQPPPRVPLPFDLLSVATVREPALEDRWEDGVEWETMTPYGPGVVGPYTCSGTTGLPKTLDPLPLEMTEATSFLTYGHFRCSPVGWTVEQARQRAVDRLLASEVAAAEEQVWSGMVGAVPTLTGAPVELASDAQGVALGIGLLDQYIARTYGAQGVIHMTRLTAEVALTASVLEVRNGKLFTVLGTPVVAGTGYTGTGPMGQEPDGATQWAYATPAVLVYRSEIFSPDEVAGSLLDRRYNDLYAIAERRWLVGWDSLGGESVGTVRLDLTSKSGSSGAIITGALSLTEAPDGALVITVDEENPDGP